MTEVDAASATTGIFTVNASGLATASGYSFAAFATNATGNDYSSVATFTTLPAMPIVTSPTSANITPTSATMGGNVTSGGTSALTKVGVVYSQFFVNSNPQLGGTGVTELDAASATTGVFTVNAIGLIPFDPWEFAAFATNSAGTTYSSLAAFVTLPMPPTVTTPTSANLTPTTATLGGNVTSEGTFALTKVGLVYALTSTNPNPIVGGSGVTEVDLATPTIGVFTVNAGSLTPGSGYSFAAFAITSGGPSYSSVATFTTLPATPVVTSPTSANVTLTTATLGGNVTSGGTSALTQVGLVYALTSTNPNPTVGGGGVTEVDLAAPATGVFTVNASGLTAGSGYSFAAFAINASGPSYSSVATFTTLPPTPIVTSPTSANVTLTTATLGGNVTSGGTSTLTKVGVVYALNITNPNPAVGGSGVTEVDLATPATGVFTVSASRLTSGSGDRSPPSPSIASAPATAWRPSPPRASSSPTRTMSSTEPRPASLP